MPLPNFLKSTFIICLVLSLFSSCTKDGEPTAEEQNIATTSIRSLMNDDDSSSHDSNENEDFDEDHDEACFSLVFPLDIVFPNGSTLTSANEEELEEDVDAYYEANPDTVEDPRPVYPITVKLEGTQVQVINNDDDFNALLERCEDFYDDDIIICFEIEYPINIIYPNGTSQDVNNDDELRNAIAAWESTNTSEEEPTLNYPVKIILEDGTPITITNDDELEAAFDSCYDDCEEDYDYDDEHDEDVDDCFDIVFPITLILGNDKQIVNSDGELDSAIDAWENANPDSDHDITAEYPVTITFPDGSQETITSEEEMEAAFDAC